MVEADRTRRAGDKRFDKIIRIEAASKPAKQINQPEINQISPPNPPIQSLSSSNPKSRITRFQSSSR